MHTVALTMPRYEFVFIVDARSNAAAQKAADRGWDGINSTPLVSQSKTAALGVELPMVEP